MLPCSNIKVDLKLNLITVGGWVEGDLVTSGEIFSPTAVSSLFDAHRRGTDGSGDLVWRVMMLEQWRHHWHATL